MMLLVFSERCCKYLYWLVYATCSTLSASKSYVNDHTHYPCPVFANMLRAESESVLNANE